MRTGKRRAGQSVLTIALPGMSDSRRTDTPAVRSMGGKCARCGEAARLPDEPGAVCSRCELGQSPERGRENAAMFSHEARAAAQAEVKRKFGKWS